MNAANAETPPVIAVHGGAWDWPDELDAAKLAALRAALEAGQKAVTNGGSAVDAVEQAVRSMEDDPVFDAGYGGYLNQAGVVQLDALIIDGSTGDFGAVAGTTKSANPVSVARHVMEQLPECFYVGDGADAIAEACGLAGVDGASLETPAMREYFEARRTDGPCDTVGAVAIDPQGRLASATSTSGTPYKPPGRVGDSAIFGAGGYAADGVAAVGSTGNGEQIYRTLLAKYASDCVALGVTDRPNGGHLHNRPIEPTLSRAMASSTRQGARVRRTSVRSHLVSSSSPRSQCGCGSCRRVGRRGRWRRRLG